MENNKYNNYYSRKTISELIAELRLWKNDTTKADWYQALILHLLERELSEVERKQADNIINSDKKTLTQGLEDLIELYISKTINKEEFEALKQELFIDKKIASPPIAKPEIKSNSEIEIKDKSQPKVQSIKYKNNNSTNSTQKKELKALVAVAAFLIICFAVPYLVKTTSVSTNSNNNNNNNSTQISTPNNTENSTTNNTQAFTYRCEICGSIINDRGYCEDASGNWRPCTEQDNTTPHICSYQCAMAKKQKIDNAWNKSSFGNKITSGVYESDENGLKTYLRFEGSDGSQGMFGSLTLSNNASSCKYVYTYNISGSNIKANFYGSDCGANSSDQTFTYNENLNTISCYINGQKFVFKSIY